MQNIQVLFKKYAFLFALIAAIVFFRCYDLGSQSIYGDEGYSIYYSQQQFSELLPFFLKDQNPPLHMMLLHFWMKLFGVSDVSAKAMSVFFSVLAAIVLYAFSKKYLDKTATVLVSVLFLMSNAQQFYATEVRTYALIQFLCISSFYIYFRLLASAQKKDIFLLLLINLLLLFSHYLSVFIFVVQFLCCFLFLKQHKKGVLFYFISQVLTLIVFIPWLRIMLGNIPKTGSFWNQAPGLDELRWHIHIINGNERLFYVFSAIVICSLVMLLLNRKFRFYNADFQMRYYVVFLLLYVLPVVLDFAVAQYTPVFLSRYILYSTFGLFLLVAYTISCLNTTPLLKAVTFVPLLYLLVVSFELKQEREDDWKTLVPMIKAEQGPHSVIFISASYKYKEFAFYYDRDAFKDYTKTLERLAAKGVYCSPKEEPYSWNKLDFDTISKIIYVQSHSQFQDPQGKIREDIIAQGFKRCDFYREKNGAYSVFIRDTMDCRQLAASAIDTLICAPAATVNKNNPFGAGYTVRLKDLKRTGKIMLSAQVSGEKETESRLVFSLERKGKVLMREEIPLSEARSYKQAKETIYGSFVIPNNQPQDAELKIYFWNPGAVDLMVEDACYVMKKAH